MSQNTKDMKSSKNMNRDLHPCQYCSKICFGLQCKDCHLSMEKRLSGECSDCKKTFRAKRDDGSSRKRCLPCHRVYMENHFATCKCGETFMQLLEDGRRFSQCFKCYQSSKKRCSNCESFTVRDNTLCSDCYKKGKSETSSTKSQTMYNCRKKSCKEKTAFENGYCKNCYQDNRETADQYMISRCNEPGCFEKYRGNYKFCKDHSRK